MYAACLPYSRSLLVPFSFPSRSFPTPSRSHTLALILSAGICALLFSSSFHFLIIIPFSHHTTHQVFCELYGDEHPGVVERKRENGTYDIEVARDNIIGLQRLMTSRIDHLSKIFKFEAQFKCTQMCMSYIYTPCMVCSTIHLTCGINETLIWDGTCVPSHQPMAQLYFRSIWTRTTSPRCRVTGFVAARIRRRQVYMYMYSTCTVHVLHMYIQYVRGISILLYLRVGSYSGEQ